MIFSGVRDLFWNEIPIWVLLDYFPFDYLLIVVQWELALASPLPKDSDNAAALYLFSLSQITANENITLTNKLALELLSMSQIFQYQHI